MRWGCVHRTSAHLGVGVFAGKSVCQVRELPGVRGFTSGSRPWGYLLAWKYGYAPGKNVERGARPISMGGIIRRTQGARSMYVCLWVYRWVRTRTQPGVGPHGVPRPQGCPCPGACPSRCMLGTRGPRSTWRVCVGRAPVDVAGTHRPLKPCPSCEHVPERASAPQVCCVHRYVTLRCVHCLGIRTSEVHMHIQECP